MILFRFFCMLSAIFVCSNCSGQLLTMDWNDISGGSIGSVEVEFLEQISSSERVRTGQNFDNPDYMQPIFGVDELVYQTDNDWELSFPSKLRELHLYAKSWRGAFFEGRDDPPVTYTFDHPFSIVSGFGSAEVSGNTLILDDDITGFHDGVLRFDGTLDSLSVDSDGSTSTGLQVMTFRARAVPEPSNAILICFVAGLLGVRRR